jgi:hypothetical protein
VQGRFKIVATATPTLSTRATKESTQDVTEVTKVAELAAAKTTRAASHWPHATNLVVLLTFLRITDDVVRRGDFFKPLFGPWIRVGV